MTNPHHSLKMDLPSFSPTSVAALLVSVMLATGCVMRNPNLESGLRMTEGGIGTAPSMPPFAASDEANAEQLERARDEGSAVEHEVAWAETQSATTSGTMAAGEYVVTYLITPAAAYVVPDAASGRLVAHDAPADGSIHLGVVVRDAADGRLVPGLDVRATIGRTTTPLPFGWYPVLNRYGENVSVPAGGAPFGMRIVIQPPMYMRHDPTNGDRFADSVVAQFTQVSVPVSASMRAPQTASSDDSAEALRVARGEGDALRRSLNEMFSSVAVNGTQMRVGDYDVVLAVERAETFWEMRHGKLQYNFRPERSAATNAHIEVGVRDAVTGRFLPGLTVHATVRDANHRVVWSEPVPFMWHPWIHHYGSNMRVPRTGRYSVQVHVDVPAFRRYGAGTSAMDRFARPIDVEFPNIRIVTGEK